MLRRWQIQRRSGERGISFVELVIASLISGILFVAFYQMMRGNMRTTSRVFQTGSIDDQLTRLTILMTNDITRAGSDPTGAALNAFQDSTGCSGKVYFKYGINPDPADSGCTGLLGDIQILSYVAYDDNGDNTIDVEESLDLTSSSPALRAGGDDNIVYAFIDTDSDTVKDTIVRRNYGDVDTSSDDVEEVIIQNAVSFTIKYYGFDEDGDYGGEITDFTRKDDIREVEIIVSVAAAQPEAGYTNPDLASSHPLVNYRTEETTFRVALLVRKE